MAGKDATSILDDDGEQMRVALRNLDRKQQTKQKRQPAAALIVDELDNDVLAEEKRVADTEPDKFKIKVQNLRKVYWIDRCRCRKKKAKAA